MHYVFAWSDYFHFQRIFDPVSKTLLTKVKKLLIFEDFEERPNKSFAIVCLLTKYKNRFFGVFFHLEQRSNVEIILLKKI